MMKSNLPKRMLCALLIGLLLTATLALASCGNGTDPKTEETTASVTEAGTVVETEGPDQTLDVPEVYYDGYTFSVFSIVSDTAYTMLDVEKLTAEPVNDAIYERNRIIENRFGIQFECVGDEWHKMLNHLNLQVSAGVSGDEGYDLIMLISREAYQATINNLLLPYSELEYIDTDKDYYFRAMNEQYQVGGHTFLAYGKDCLNVLSASCGLMYNKDIAEDIQAENMYDLVRNQAWTYERMFEYAEMAASDLDGDGKLKLDDDRLGLIGHYDKTVPGFWVSAGESLIEKDENGLPVCNLPGNERIITVMQEALRHIDTEAYSVLSLGNVYSSFMEDEALFLSACLDKLNTLRAMETDYGVLPFPKYDTAQENYVTRNIDGWLHCVPNTCKDTEMTSIIMQALAYYSDKTVYDAYYEQALNTRFVRDLDSVEMIRLMLDTVEVDLGDTIWQAYLRAPIVDTINQKGDQIGFGSLFASYKKIADQRIKVAVKYIDKMTQ